ncbi:MAG: ArgE/DapE family deacylase [Opitutaceae bacterium]
MLGDPARPRSNSMTPSSYLDAHVSDLVGLLRRLVQIPTVNPPGQSYGVITDLLVEELKAAGLAARRFTPTKAELRAALPPEQWSYPRSNVLGTLRVGRSQRTLHFNAHYDVVPVSEGWRHGSAFSGTEDRGWVYGRGTSDMKGSIASLLLALRALRATGTRPNFNVEVSFTADEETDSALGAHWLVQHAPIRPDFAVVMEGGEANRVCCGHNGVVWLEVTVHGRAAHGSTPEHGVNALEKMAALVTALSGFKKQLRRRTFEAPDGKVMVPTLNVGGVFTQGSGGKINTVPALARFSLDRRVLAIESLASAERELRGFLQTTARSIPGCRISVAKVSESKPCFNRPAHPFFDAMAGCVSRVRRQPAEFSVSTGFNDMHFFSEHLRVPTLGYGPGGQAFHAVNERASVRELLACAKIYTELMTTFSG